MYVGVDIVHIVRIKKNIKNFTFIDKIFTSKEIKYCNSYPKPENHFSGKFAAKEADKKALLSGKIVNNISMKEIQVLNNSDKSPYIIINKLDDVKCNISISHDGDYAIAFVIIEK